MGRKSRNKKRQLSETNPLLNRQQDAIKPRPYLPRRIWLYGLAVAFATLVIYMPALKNDFVYWDDPSYVYENTNITNLNTVFLKWIFTFHASNWHPLTWVSHAIDFHLWGLNPLGHHLSGIIFHSANTFLLFYLVVYLISSSGSSAVSSISDSGNRKKALIAGAVASLFFGIMPVHVESVAWVSERKDVLSTFFVLLSLISYIRYCSKDYTEKRSRYYISCLIFFILALMSKPMAITLPVVMLLLDAYPLQRLGTKAGPKIRPVLTEKFPFFLLSAVSGVLTLFAQSSGGAVGTFEAYPLSSRILVAAKALLFYLEKMFFPIKLSPYYPYPKDASLASVEFMFPVILVIVITSACYYAWRKRHKIFLISWLFYLITLLPVIGIIQVGAQAAADRYTYMPSFAPLLILGLGTALILEKQRDSSPFLKWRNAIILSSIAVYSLLMGAATIKQINLWKDSITLWSAALSMYQSSPQPYLARSEVFMSMGKYEEALKDLENAIRLNPDYADAYYNRATVHLKLDDYANVVNDLNNAVRLKPSMDKAYFVRGTAYIKLGEYNQAITDLDRFLLTAPSYVAHDGYYSRAIAYTKKGDYRNAIKDLTKYLEIVPAAEKAKKYMAYLERASAHIKSGNLQEAINDSTKAIEMDPYEIKGYNYRAGIYFSQGDFQRTIDNFTEGIKFNPNNFELYGRRGTVYLKIGKNREAIQDFQKAAQMGDPKSQEFLRAKGIKWQ